MFTRPRYPESQWKSIRFTNAIERLHKEFNIVRAALRRDGGMLFWALVASGQTALRQADVWQRFREKPREIDLAAWNLR